MTDLFLYNFDTANYFVDISEVWEEKLAVLRAHASQVDEASITRNKTWCKIRGEEIEVTLAEGFMHVEVG